MPIWFIEECEKLADLYSVRFLEPARRECPRLDTDVWDSLKFFLMGYAFERQGRAQDYLPIARDAVDECRDSPLSDDSARRVWQVFLSKLGNVGPNMALNPLCPNGESYQRKWRDRTSTCSTRQPSVVQLAVDEFHGEPMVSWAGRLLKEDRVEAAYDVLLRLNGVSGKIASFFLRDVAIIHEIAPAGDRHLLQPVDTWVRMVARNLSGDGTLDDTGSASYIVEDSVQPERANQGIWYFCSQVASSSQYLVRRSMSDRAYMRGLVRHHLGSLVETGKAASSCALEWGIEI